MKNWWQIALGLSGTLLALTLYQNCSRKGPGTSNQEPSVLSVSENQGSSALSSSDIYNKSNLLWIGAHPDDEQYVSFLLKDFCSKPGKSCTIISMTKGEAGKCQLPQGCLPDLVSVRRQEFLNSAEYLNSSQKQYDLADGSAPNKTGVLTAWSAQVGGAQQLVQMVTSLIQTIAPDVIITFDPRHGTSCHADHRAVGELVGVAAQGANFLLSDIYFVETLASQEGLIPATREDSNLEVYSVTDFWEVLIHLIDVIYPSQQTKATVESAKSLPESGQTLSLLRANQADPNDSRYTTICK